ncbi:MAG: 5'-methylthioadenosine/S-adenosylhomocysteine nucleosidase [Gammaproteobacteria bacterium RIFCSPHIGHO2_12_FULL_40_19]|nr:MAG: 5'-methylthioadenosine/S-adenosylhomocysteine nucleosidase [Gammaproteobacteria bacterium RIFCSPHIGHO2_12_FULL_40_19]
MKIGIMGAMPQEVDSILSHMTDVNSIERGSRTYHVGKINSHDVVLVFSRWGKVASATTATSLITEFKIDQLIFTGVAGASSATLNIGDVVVSSQLYQHDMDARPLMPRHEIPLTGMTFFKADAALVRKAHSAAQGVLSTLSQDIPSEELAVFGVTAPKCVVGTIATGDQFIADPARTEAIMAEKPETMAVEMEGAAVAQVCNDYSVPFVVIRTISDKADHLSAIDFPKFIEKIARHYSERIVTSMLSEKRDVVTDDNRIAAVSNAF